MGLKNSAAVYQGFMDRMTSAGAFDFCASYIDDVVVHSRDLQTHLIHLQHVFLKAVAHGASISLEKCDFFCTDPVLFLGYEISGSGWRPSSKLVQGLDAIGPPKTLKDLRSVLGLLNFHRSFIRAYSQKTYRLVQATKRGTKFNGLTKDEADDLTRLIAELRKFVIEKLQLYHVDWNYPIQLFTDASKFGIGGMAYQEIGGEMRPLMYISRSVSDAEKKYEDLLFPANTAAHETRQIELLALIFCLEEVSTTLGVLQGSGITIHTDHRNIVTMFNSAMTKDISGGNDRILRWCIRLSQFDVKVRYRQGVRNEVADCMSRLYDSEKTAAACEFVNSHALMIDEESWNPDHPTIQDHPNSSRQFVIRLAKLHDDAEISSYSARRQAEVSAGELTSDEPQGLDVRDHYEAVPRPIPKTVKDPPTLEEVRALQDADPLLLKIKTELQREQHQQDMNRNSMDPPPTGSRPLKRAKSASSQLIRGYALDNLDIVCKETGRHATADEKTEVVPATVPVIPNTEAARSFRQRIMNYAHTGIFSAHCGVHGTIYRVKRRFYWVGMDEEIKIWVRACIHCRLAKTNTTGRHGYLESYQHFGPFHTVAIDLLDLKGDQSISPEGFKEILIIYDLFTRFLIAVPLADRSMKSVASALIWKLFTVHGSPVKIVADNAFSNEMFEELMGILGSECQFVSPYNSRSNPAERYCGHVQRLLRAWCSEWPERKNGTDWYGQAWQYLDFVAMAHNTSPMYAGSDLSPWEVVNGRKFRWPSDLVILQDPGLLPDKIDIATYYKHRVDKFTEVSDFIKRMLHELIGKNAARHDALQDSLMLKPGDLVTVHVPNRKGKLACQHAGPAEVLEKHSELLYRVRFLGNNNAFLAHVRRLHRYHPIAGSKFASSRTRDRHTAIDNRVARSPEMKKQLLGRTVRKFFGKNAFDGKVIEVLSPEDINDVWLYKIRYEDGDVEDLEERELNRVLLIDSTPSTTPTGETTLSIDDVHIGDLVLLQGNEDKRYYVGKVTECFPDTDELTLHYFAHQMTHSGGRRGKSIYDDRMPLKDRTLKAEYVYYSKSNRQMQHVRTNQPKRDYRPFSEKIKLGKGKYDMTLILADVRLDNDHICKAQLTQLANMLSDGS